MCCSDDLFKTFNMKNWKCPRGDYMEHVLSLEDCIRSKTCFEERLITTKI